MAVISATQAGSDDAIAFLDTLGWSEGTDQPPSLNSGYDQIVRGLGDAAGGEQFTNYAQHPFAGGRPPKLIVAPGARFPNGLRSDAAGRYQFMLKTWRALQTQLDLPDFSPLSQDLAALELVRQRGALGHLNSGSIDAAITAHYAQPVDLVDAVEEDSNIWASLPGNDYGQGGHSMAAVVSKFEEIRTGLGVA